ncbi:MAG: hypothetical protein E7591_06760 [Ruminococcaceae bacterium]|nr:hypothetical protein [Oscillospiraceae bacterium]
MKTKAYIMIFVLCILFTSCVSSPDSAYDILQRLYTNGLVLPDGYIYISGSELKDTGYISPEELGSLFYDEEKPPEELSVIESYAIYISKEKSPTELHIMKAKYRSEKDTLSRMLSRRKNILQKPEINPYSCDFLCEKPKECEVFSKGDFVFLVAGEDISRITEIIEKTV